jgi:hypothetical protein
VDKLQPGMKVALGTPGTPSGESGNSDGGRGKRDASGGGAAQKRKK